MRARFGFGVAAVVVALLVAGGVVSGRAGPDQPSAVSARGAYSGAWFCPHGGGPEGWQVALLVANPGDRRVEVRVSTFGRKAPVPPRTAVVPPHARIRMQVEAVGRERSSLVEYFGGWVAASWVSTAGGKESGIAAEPCLPSAATSWLLPTATTVEGQDSWTIVMNPFASEAVFSLELTTEHRTTREKRLSAFVLPARRSVAFRLNRYVLGERTVAGRLTVSLGRVAAATLGVPRAGGAWSVEGVRGTARRLVLPGGGDAGRSDVPVVDTGGTGARFGIAVVAPDGTRAAQGLTAEQLAPGEVTTENVTAPDPSTVVVTSAGRDRITGGRRTVGPGGDVAGTGPVVPSRGWVLQPAALGAKALNAPYLVDTGTSPETVVVSALDGDSTDTVRVALDPGRQATIPAGWLSRHAGESLLAVSRVGRFVATETGTVAGSGYAVSSAVAVPARWLGPPSP
jgi:hypothetical protein